jgi:epoxyqueuosine reductase
MSLFTFSQLTGYTCAMSDATPQQPETRIAQLGLDLGFAMTGIAAATATNWAEYLNQWLSDGKHGEMSYLAQHAHVRVDPANLLPGARSVICVADRYAHQTDLQPHQPAGRIARYAWGDDYHKVLKKRLMQMADQLRELYPDEQFRVAVDTAPILEREYAQQAGLGWIGKHTLLIAPQLGSWFVLGEIVTTLQLSPTVDKPMPDHCGTCTRCIDACPTHCISPYQLDATKCISYLTLEHRSEIPVNLQTQMDDWLAGCDICQEVCPHNLRPRKFETVSPAYHERYTPRPPAPAVNLLEVLNWDAHERQQAFIGSALKRMKLEMVKRNAIIAAGNYLAQHNDTALYQRLNALMTDENEHHLVRNTAKNVINRINAQQQQQQQQQPQQQ